MQIEKHMTNATVIQLPERMLIRSKLDRPPLLGQLVARPRLIEQLDEGRNARATLIAAPAGYGKTTLALQWLSGSGIASSWIRLDQFDRNPWQFIRYLVAALHPRSGNGLQRTRALLEGRVCPPWRYVTDVLLGELAEVRERTVLVLEDYHAIDTPDVHALIGPSAGPRQYEVSHEMAQDWQAHGLPSCGRLLDLWEANTVQLCRMGVPRSQVTRTEICTISDDRFFSYRRGDGTARNMAIFML